MTRSAWSVPNVPGKVFASAEDHATLAITPALEGLCRRRAVAFGDASPGRRGSGEDGGVVVCDEGSHVWGGLGEGVFDGVCVEGGLF